MSQSTSDSLTTAGSQPIRDSVTSGPAKPGASGKSTRPVKKKRPVAPVKFQVKQKKKEETLPAPRMTFRYCVACSCLNYPGHDPMISIVKNMNNINVINTVNLITFGQIPIDLRLPKFYHFHLDIYVLFCFLFFFFVAIHQKEKDIIRLNTTNYS